MNQPINRSSGRHRILEDRLPFAQWKIARQHYAATLVTIGQQREQNLHLLPALLHVTNVVDHQNGV